MQIHSCSQDDDEEEDKINLLRAFLHEQMWIEVKSWRKSLSGFGIQSGFLY